MSTEPPRGPWSDLMDQVRDALEDAGIGAGEVRDEVVQGVSDALRALRGAGSDPGAAGAGVGPHVDVVEGGRAEGSPVSAGPRPDLHVAEPPAEPDRGDGGSARVKVTVQRAQQVQALGGEIAFALADDESQTLFRGASAHPYRVAADSGALRVVLDGAPAETLHEGQSMDVEAAHLRVAAEGGSASGRCLRLPR